MESRPEQTAWVVDHFNAIAAALTCPNPADPVNGYPRYMDVDSFCDEDLLRMFSRDAHATQLSSYFFKPRNGRMEFGPIWDFDRSLGAEGSVDPTGAIPITFWWDALLGDAAFSSSYKELYADYRQSTFSLAHINSIIDQLAAAITESVLRDADKWSQVTDLADWQAEVDSLKTWISERVDFLDSQWLPAP